jgi:hypothetical protein
MLVRSRSPGEKSLVLVEGLALRAPHAADAGIVRAYVGIYQPR